MALFGMKAKEWRTKNPNLDGNIRDYAIMNELIGEFRKSELCFYK